MLGSLISFGKNILLGQVNGFLKNFFNKKLTSTRDLGEKNCFPLDIVEFLFDTIKGWLYVGMDVN